jgi:hypothetical protein
MDPSGRSERLYADVAAVTGLTPANVATKIHRIKQVLTRRFHQGVANRD